MAATTGGIWTSPQALAALAQTNARPIESYDLATGRMVKKYPSQTSVFKDGYLPEAVRAVLHGHRTDYKGMGWRYTATTPANKPAVLPPAPTPEDPAVAITLLTDAHRRNELASIAQAIRFVPSRNEWAVHFSDGRVLYRPTRPEAINLWYNECSKETTGEVVSEREQPDLAAPIEEAPRKTEQGTPEPAMPTQTPVQEPRRQYPHLFSRCGYRVEGFIPKTGQVRIAFIITQAERRGYARRKIVAALDKPDKQYLRLSWRRAPVTAGLPKVEGCCPTTGNVLAQFDSYDAIITAGYNPTAIAAALKSHSCYRHLRWRTTA